MKKKDPFGRGSFFDLRYSVFSIQYTVFSIQYLKRDSERIRERSILGFY